MVGSFFNFIGGFSIAFIVISLLLILLLVVALIIAIFFEKRLAKVLNRTRYGVEARFKNEILRLKSSGESPENKFASIDKSARNFLSKKYKINRNMDYSEIIRHFAKKDRTIEGFSKKMIEGIYSGQKMDEKKIKSILNELEYLAKRKGPKIHSKAKMPKFTLYGEGKKIISKLPFMKGSKIKAVKTAKNEAAAKKEKSPETGEKTREEQINEINAIEKENYQKQLMSSEAMAAINKLSLQKVVLQGAFEEGYVKKQVYKSSMQNINIVMSRLKKKYL